MQNVFAQKNDTIHFEKIYFESSPCDGICSAYELQIDNSKTIHLLANMVYKQNEIFPIMDKRKLGYYIGTLSDSIYTSLLNGLKSSNIYTENFDKTSITFGNQKIKIIVYFNNKQKRVYTEEPYGNLEKLIETFFKICEKSHLKKTRKKFIFDGPKREYKN